MNKWLRARVQTCIVATSPCDAHEVFDEMRRLLGCGDAAVAVDQPCDWGPPGVRCLRIASDGAADLRFVVYYRDHDALLRRSKGAVDWVELDIEAEADYQGPRGEGCEELHDRLVDELGDWLDERGIEWSSHRRWHFGAGRARRRGER